MDTKKLKEAIIKSIDADSKRLIELSLKIHDNPELGFQEVKAAGWLTEYLKKNGFSIECGIARLDTAFRATYGEGRPAIAILAEYDALAGMGHGCGHNIICTAAVAAGVAAKKAVDELGGSVHVIGTPGEEGGGGKVFMAERGAFKNLDVAMITHPEIADFATTKALACQTLDIEFFGKSAHAAASPELGINALEAMLLSFASINSLRQHIRGTARIHGIITDGGKASNIVPEHSAGSFIVRAMENDYLDELKEKVLNCFAGAATGTGARMEYKWGERYDSLRNNVTLAKLHIKNMQALGRNMKLESPDTAFGSTDMGNVSQIVPSIHPFIAIADRGTLIHSTEFAGAAASERGMKSLLDAAKGMAMTAADLLSNPDILAKIKEEFENDK